MAEVGHGEELALFQPQPVDQGVESIEWVDYRPTGVVAAGAPLEFNVPGTGSSYIDLKGITFSMALRILKNDGSSLKWEPGEDAKKDIVSLINMPAHSMFKTVEMYIQQKLVSNLGGMYPYKTNLDVVTGVDAATKEGVLKAQLYCADQATLVDEEYINPHVIGLKKPDPGIRYRWGWTMLSKWVQLEGRLYLDLCQQDRYLLNGLPLQFKMWPADKSFYLLSPETTPDYRVVIDDVKLRIAMVKLRPEVLLGHDEALKVMPALYPYTRSDIRTYAIPTGLNTVTVEDLFQGKVPEQVIIGVVSSRAFTGDYKKNPYTYKHYHCNFVGFYVNGQSMPSNPLQPDFDNEKYMEAYRTLVRDEDLNITRENYMVNMCLYVLDVYGKRKKSQRMPVRAGHTRLEMKFAKPLPESVTVIVYGKFPACMKVDRERNVTLE